MSENTVEDRGEQAVNGARQLVSFIVAGCLSEGTDFENGTIDMELVRKRVDEQMNAAVAAMRQDAQFILTRFAQDHPPEKLKRVLAEEDKT